MDCFTKILSNVSLQINKPIGCNKVFWSNATEEEINNLHQQVSTKVKELRLKNEMSQLELALTIGLKSGAFFGNAENTTNGKHFNIEHIYKIAKALKVPMSVFFEPIQENDYVDTELKK